MPLTNYVTLGKSGLKVSPLCLGTMTFGKEWGWGSDVPESLRILEQYIELGGNFIDTANFYTHGHSEKVIGDLVGPNAALRDRLVIATKFFGSMRPGDPNAGGAGRKNIFSACEHSLRRLQTDYIDLYWMHCWDYQTPIDETVRALDDLVAAGKVRYIGFSDTPAWKVVHGHMLAEAHGRAPVSAIQVEYSLLERTVEGDLLPMARDFGLGVTPWSPLKSGILSGKYTRDSRPAPGRGARVDNVLNEPRTMDVIDAVLEVARQIGSSPARVALAWVCGQPGVTSPIIGARTLEQLEDNLAALEVQLPAEQLDRLSKASQPKLNFPHDFLAWSPSFRNPETTINGESAPANPLAVGVDRRPY